MSKTTPERLIIGPSHVVRLRHALATRQLPELTRPSRLIGVGGLPIWSPRITKELATATSESEVFVIVGDFRFGNPVLNDPAFTPDYPQPKEYLAIEKDLINETNDQRLFALSLTALDALKQQLNGRLRLLFWDLSIREYQNRSTGRYYQESGDYRHPVWNLDAVLAQFSDIAIDSRVMLSHGEQLFIDSSAHPSLIGWLYINRYLRGATTVDLSAVLQAFDQALTQLLAAVLTKEAVLITGDSKFTRLLALFVSNRQFLLPDNWQILPLSKAYEAQGFDRCLYFPGLCTFELDEAGIAEGIGKVKRISARLTATHKQVSVLYYDNWAYEAISKRSGYQNKFVSRYDSGLTAQLEAVTCPPGQAYKITDSTDFEGMIELNATLLPSVLGIVEILARSTRQISHEQVLAAYQDFLTACL
ncbi:hypothetical protein KFZ76_17415 [Methylovulum psychrotolerans]|uniref:hypothetical protein n=1 Tax=Methylovulum psychrotolerans TaxID=1704499 RepID=UPI001BFF40C6|nr:hypothetical protein [Methylovulum psychrotolerans]MBT9099477.1 hypothetical protein [Methylovulum psychrotolerans]